MLTKTNALNETWTYTYNATDKMLSSTSPMGEVTTYTYDPFGNLLSKTDPHEAGEAAEDFTTTYTYGPLQRRTSMHLPSGGSFFWTYDTKGHEIEVKDGDGNVLRSRTVDSRGRVRTETTRFGTYTYSYPNAGEFWTLPSSITDPLGRVTTFGRNTKMEATRRTENGVSVRYIANRDGRMERIEYGNGLNVFFEYEGDSKQWSAIYGPSFGRKTRQFWADGKPSQIVEPNGDTREFFYDPNRRLRREKDELGNFTTYTRDRAGRVTRIREDATGAETEFEHDADGRVTKRIDPYDRETTMTYRAGGRLATLTDARNHTRAFEDTPTSRTVVDALSRTTVRHMNAYGLTMTTSLPGGTGTSLSYVGQTRMDESQRFPLEVVDEGSRVRSYGYDTHQGMTSASDLGGENDWSYTYGLTRGAQIVWGAESGSVELAPVDARASAYEFSGVQGIRTEEGRDERKRPGRTTLIRCLRRGGGTRRSRESRGRSARCHWRSRENVTP